MLFNSYGFIFLFLPLVLLGYYGLGRVGVRAASGWLAAASLSFYAYWDIRFLPVLLVSILFNYLIGRQISGGHGRRFWLGIGILGNVAALGYYKYTGFLMENINAIWSVDLPVPDIILPIGISFFTFTQTAYLVDLYRGETNHASLVYYTEFVTIFPHLIAGPIISHRKMMPQFLDPENLRINYRNMAMGLTLFLAGLGKKVLIADNLSPWANFVFSQTDHLNLLLAWMGSLAYTLQLYFDFSGYSDMAVGLGLMMNMKIPQNFLSPYQASNFIDLWRRWHVTLGVWVRDYLYIPLGGNRYGEVRKYGNLFFAMLIIGLWHGAGWTYILWGALHGVLLVANHLWRKMGGNMPRPIAWPLTFISWSVGLTIFRADTLADAMKMLTAMMDISHICLPASSWLENHLIFLGAAQVNFIAWPEAFPFVKVGAVLLILLVTVMSLPNPHAMVRECYRPSASLAVLLLFVAALAMAGMTQPSEFLYFQF